MHYLQPTRKSYGNYIKIGYEFANHKKVDSKLQELFDKITIIDDSVLIIDDILDQSEFRNGKLCFYKIYGLQNAIITAKLQESESINVIIYLAKVLKTKEHYVLKVLETFNEFLYNVYVGQRMDYELSQIKEFSPKLMKKYFDMIRIFTGGHVKYGVRIGQLLANKDTNRDIDILADSIGVIRQICDDYNDYFEQHHEPFGDFKIGCNRLPELLFKKHNGNREKILKLISQKKYSEVREIVLTLETRKAMYEYCKKEHAKIEGLLKKYEILISIENFKTIIE